MSGIHILIELDQNKNLSVSKNGSRFYIIINSLNPQTEITPLNNWLTCPKQTLVIYKFLFVRLLTFSSIAALLVACIHYAVGAVGWYRRTFFEPGVSDSGSLVSTLSHRWSAVMQDADFTPAVWDYYQQSDLRFTVVPN